MRGLIALILFTILGPALTYVGLKNKSLKERLANEGKTVPGVIVGGEWKKYAKGAKPTRWM